jgi:hypothetical protein
MDVRAPDCYKTETLLDSLPEIRQPVDEDEVELAILASLEEEYKQLEQCSSQWDRFQEILNRLKRIGNYDKNVLQLYEILSIYLYKYAYHIYEALSEETYQFIQTHLKRVRMTTTECNLLHTALNRLRSGP